MPLCHWPCSCYPNHALGQVNDWMNEIYPRWVAAHGVMIVTPVYWYQAPSVLKLMIDRLVCADGGNPDPTSTPARTPRRPRRSSSRDGTTRDTSPAGASPSSCTATRRAPRPAPLALGLARRHASGAARHAATIDRYIGCYEPYATSHDALDEDLAIQDETRIAARHLVDAVRAYRSGRVPADARGDEEPRSK